MLTSCFSSVSSFCFIQIGTYNPVATKDNIKEITADSERVRYWIANGAQPSDRVAWLFGALGILPQAAMRQSTKFLIPKSLQKKEKT